MQGQRLVELIESLIESSFYGEIVVKFEAGKVVIVRKTENIKLGDY